MNQQKVKPEIKRLVALDGSGIRVTLKVGDKLMNYSVSIDPTLKPNIYTLSLRCDRAETKKEDELDFPVIFSCEVNLWKTKKDYDYTTPTLAQESPETVLELEA